MQDLNKKNGISCAIMAGGQNKRMGRHKAFLDYRGKKFIELIRENMQTWFDDIFIVTNDKYIFSDHYGPVFEDIIPDIGPLGALYTALTVSGTEYVFCVACDMPYPNDSLISRLIQASHDRYYDCLVPRGERGLEPLFSLYRKSLLSLIREEITSIQLKISGIYAKCQTSYIDIPYDIQDIININTPGDYLRFAGETNDRIESESYLIRERVFT